MIVTSCFDQVLEQAFIKADQPFDRISYIVEKDQKSIYFYQKFDHRQDGDKNTPIVIKDRRKISEIEETEQNWLEERPVILRIYGPAGVDGVDWAVTEDYFIEHLMYQISTKLPVTLWNKLSKNHLWFLGYGLSYWNLRSVLRQINSCLPQKPEKRQFTWWAIQESSTLLDKKLWVSNHVELLSGEILESLLDQQNQDNQSLLGKYIDKLQNRLYQAKTAIQ